MRTFIVVTEVSDRCDSGELKLELHLAKSLDDLLFKLEEWDGTVDEFRQGNGDGGNYYLVKELLPDGTLSAELLAYA